MNHLARALQIVSCAVAGAVLLGAGTSRADAPPAAGVLTVRVLDLRSGNGQVGCALWASDKGYPKDAGAALQSRWCPIVSRESVCTFPAVAAGTYAVACFHDENRNGVLDTGLFGIPTEGVVASNQAKGFMGPPKFKDAKFSFAGSATEMRLKMGY